MINRILLLSAFVVCFATATIAQNYTEANLLVDYEGINVSESLTTETQSMLKHLLQNVPIEEEIAQIEITAHAESRDIGEDRLAPFAQFFKKEGVDYQKLELVTQVDDNNRVHVKIRSSLKVNISVETKVVEILVEKPARSKVYCPGASKKGEVFSVEPSSNVVIKGKEGTEVNINRADLVHEDGTAVEQAIQVELKEFFKPEDILLADLHTMDGDKVLETAGMLYLKITSEGKPLALKKGRSAKLKIPNNQAKAKNGMNLYFGETRTDGAVNWNRIVRTASNNTTKDVAEPINNADNSYVQLKRKTVLDSIKEESYKGIALKNTHSSGFPAFRSRSKEYTHTEEYFDLELPYIPTPPKTVRKINRGGIWINLDRDFSIDIELPSVDPPPPPSVDILVQVTNMKISEIEKANRGARAPRVALMLKDRSVFLRGRFLETDLERGEMQLTFERVPLGQEAVLVAFLDNGEEVLYASQPLNTQKIMDVQELDLKSVDRATFKNSMAGLAN